MKKFVLTAALVSSAVLFSACNPLSLLPPIEVPDALGTADQTMDSEVAEFDMATNDSVEPFALGGALKPTAAAGNLKARFVLNGPNIKEMRIQMNSGTSGKKVFVSKYGAGKPPITLEKFNYSGFLKTLTFDDPKDLPAIPNKLNAALNAASVAFSGTGCTGLPNSITGSYTALSVEIKDANSSATVTPSSTDGSVVLTKGTDGKYSVKLDPDVSVSATGLAAVLGNGTNPNSAEIAMAIVYGNGFVFPAGCTTTITLGAAKGSYSF